MPLLAPGHRTITPVNGTVAGVSLHGALLPRHGAAAAEGGEGRWRAGAAAAAAAL